ALEAGADDVLTPEKTLTEVITQPDDFEKVRAALAAAGLKPTQADITLRPGIRVPVAGEQAEAVQKLLEWLEELDDVQQVHTNAELPDPLVSAP
ncbi:MAG: YebC/PmpR family DNA-binding transcriptional regulator, partial [Hydrocarboniphaga effusa]|nr:YebC/PmpR family DNA-binding transcriptional regulator [Hydrocarboniphaga effusa]